MNSKSNEHVGIGYVNLTGMDGGDMNLIYQQIVFIYLLFPLRMGTIDEIKDYQKYTSITFVDMLEALGRVADMMSLPSQSDLEAAGNFLLGLDLGEMLNVI